MSSTYFIERLIIASLLNYEYEAEIDANLFTTLFHRKLINGYNRLKKLGEVLDFAVLQYKFISADKWTFQEEAMLTDIMTVTPLGHKSTFDNYYKILKDEYKNSSDRRFAI